MGLLKPVVDIVTNLRKYCNKLWEYNVSVCVCIFSSNECNPCLFFKLITIYAKHTSYTFHKLRAKNSRISNILHTRK